MIGPKFLLAAGATALILAYAFSIVWHSEIWHMLLANLLIGVGIGVGYASMPMLIMRSVPQRETGASNGLNALCRSLGTSTAAAVMGAVLAASSASSSNGFPTESGFTLAFVLGIIAAVLALALALLIPQGKSPEPRPALPERG